MKRSTFIKNLAVLTGGGVIISCREGTLFEMLNPENKTSADLDVKQAKDWFLSDYLSRYSKLKSDNDLKIDREANWEKATKIFGENRQEYIVVPINYLSDNKPSYLSWTKDNAYIEKLALFYFQPIIELLVVTKDKDYDAYLFQIAYDRFSVKDNTLNLESLTGYVLLADWGNNTLRSSKYNNGRIKGVSRPGDNDKSKLAVEDCGWIEVAGYQTYDTYPDPECDPANGICGDVVAITYHKQYQFNCYNEPDNTFVDNSYLPNWISGGSFPPGYTATVSTSVNFNPTNAILGPGRDRDQMYDNLQTGLWTTGLITDIHGVTWSKAGAILRTVGADIDQFLPTMNIAGRSVGAVGGTLGLAGVLIGSAQIYVGWADNGFQWDEEGWGIAQVGLGIAGLVLGTAASPVILWGTVIIGGISIGIAIANAPSYE